MGNLEVGEFVFVRGQPFGLARIVAKAVFANGQALYKVGERGYFYASDLDPVPRGIVAGSVPEKKVVLVTGGAGYAGSVLVRMLLEEGYRVVCVDCLRYGGESLSSIWGHPGFTFERVDIRDRVRLGAILDQQAPYAVVHLAALVGDPACRREPELAREVNGEAAFSLLEQAVAGSAQRFLFASTCSNYGQMPEAGGYVDEDAPLNPISLYAQLKVEFETRLLDRGERRGDFSPTALRFATVYGWSPRMRFDLTVNEFAREIALGRELVVYGEHAWRPYCHVRDYARAILSVLSAREEKVAYQVFNVGDTTQNFTKKMITDVLLKKAPEGRVKFVTAGEDRRDYRVDFGKLRDTLDFRITRTLADGIDEVLAGVRAGILADSDAPCYSNTPAADPLRA